MASDFRFVVSDPKTRRAIQISKERAVCEALIGKKIGESFNGEVVGMNGYELAITGGTDKDGIPMRGEVHGSAKKKILLTKSVGFAAKLTKKAGESGKTYKVDMKQGVRKKKMVRGNTISDETMQINCKVTKIGEQAFDALFPPKPKEEKATA